MVHVNPSVKDNVKEANTEQGQGNIDNGSKIASSEGELDGVVIAGTSSTGDSKNLRKKRTAYLMLVLTETHMPAYPENAEHAAPNIKERPVKRAMALFEITWLIASFSLSFV